MSANNYKRFDELIKMRNESYQFFDLPKMSIKIFKRVTLFNPADVELFKAYADIAFHQLLISPCI